MKKPRIYVDTSVIGGCFDPEFQFVRFDKMQQFNGVNLELGYKALAIHSPREVTTYGREREESDQSR